MNIVRPVLVIMLANVHVASYLALQSNFTEPRTAVVLVVYLVAGLTIHSVALPAKWRNIIILASAFLQFILPLMSGEAFSLLFSAFWSSSTLLFLLMRTDMALTFFPRK